MLEHCLYVLCQHATFVVFARNALSIDRCGVWTLQVQRAAAGALRTLAFKNEENKNLIVECQALPTLIQMLRSDDVGIHYEAVGVIGNLVHSSQHIKKTVLQVRHSCCSA